MQEIVTPQFSESDIKVLESFTEEEIRNCIDFFKDHKELMWLDHNTNKIISDSELKKIEKFHYQPAPQYPKELMAIARKFYHIGVGNFEMLKEEGFFETDSMAALFPCTFFTPTLICAFFADSFRRERFSDGLLGFGIRDNIYLKMMLHLQDCHAIYRRLKEQEKTDEK